MLLLIGTCIIMIILYLLFSKKSDNKEKPIYDTINSEIIHEENNLMSDSNNNRIEIEKKEVFNIDNNKYSYEDAKKVCKDLNSELATLEQINIAHKNGANWCNYGWSEDELALYPIQESYYKNNKNCGKPGINSREFDKNKKLGVNCYGIRPKPDKNRIIYREEENETNKDKHDIEIRPFNDKSWSKYSFKKSSYILDSDILKNNKKEFEYNETDPRIIDLKEIKEVYPEDISLIPKGIKLRSTPVESQQTTNYPEDTTTKTTTNYLMPISIDTELSIVPTYESIATKNINYCSNGIISEDICCAKMCGECGGSGCSMRPGGSKRCCTDIIKSSLQECITSEDVSCIISN